MSGRHINDAGRKLIEQFEGRRRAVYKDPVGLPTVGIGHLLTAAEKARWPVGTVLTDEQINTLFAGDIAGSEQAVAKAVKVALTDNQFAALVSFTFNCGPGALQQSTLLRKVNAGDFHGAADWFAPWNKAKGKVLPGLTRRRAAEKALFLQH